MSKNYAGQPPYGFQWSNGRLVENPSEAAVRILAFELFLEHQRKGTVARILNDRGFRPRRGAKWRDVTVGRLLSCSSAIGQYAVNKTTTDKDGNRIEKPESEWDYIQCASIVAMSLWDSVSDKLTAQSVESTKIARICVHIFTGIAICGNCGTKLVVPVTNPGKYVCPTNGCSRKISEGDLDAIFQDELSAFLHSRILMLDQFLQSDEALLKKRHDLDEFSGEIEILEANISKNYQLFNESIITIDRFGSLHKPLEKRLNELKSQAAMLENDLIEWEANCPLLQSNEPSSKNLIANWPNLSLQAKQRIVRVLISQMIIGDGEIEITYNFSTPPQDAAHPTSQHPTNQSLLPLSFKDATISQQTPSPTTQTPKVTTDEPIFIRLPKSGEHCPRTGLTRSKLNQLILPTERNRFRPPVKSKSVREHGQKRGIRLILWESLRDFLEKHDC